MPQRISIRKLDSHTLPFHVHEAYDTRDNLIATDLRIETEQELANLQGRNIRYVVFSSSAELAENSTNTSRKTHSTNERSSSESPTIETPQGTVNVQDTQETYQQMHEKMESIYQDFHQGHGDLSQLDQLKPLMEDFLGYVQSNRSGLGVLTNIAEYDNMTFNHSINASIYSILYGHHQGFSEDHLFDLGFGALLHDFGKTQLPSELVQKKEKLSDEEFEQMKEHPREGRTLLREYAPSSSASEIAHQHHERPDGSGYPQGLKDLHPDALIVSVVDVFEALTAPRPYRTPVLPAKAFLMMKDEFHPYPETKVIRNNLIRCMGLFSIGSFVRLTNGMIGIVEKNNPSDLGHPRVRIVVNDVKRHVKITEKRQ